jgi:acyl carrier protein
MTPELEQRLRRLLVEQLDYRIADGEIAPETPLMGKGLGLSSLDVVALVIAVEEAFDVIFEADEVSSMVATFGALRGALAEKLGDRKSVGAAGGA